MSLPAPWNDRLDAVVSAATIEHVQALEQELFGRKAGLLTMAMKELGNVSPEERKLRGQELNVIKKALEKAIADRTEALRREADRNQAESDRLDLTLDLPEQEHGHRHLVHEFMRKAEEVFGRMGFDSATGPELETEAFQFDLLNFPRNHAARDAQDIFYVHGGNPEDRSLLRGHTSTVQIRYMQNHKPPFRMICMGKVYRKDSDATHSPMFHQIEGLMIGKSVTLANMKAVMETAVKELISADAEFRWRTGFFPFVEPGLEMDMRWRGDEAQSREGKWLEIVGCGMVHPNVLRNVGIDPEEYQGFAFGFGVERMIMIRHQIPDLRSFFQGDMRFLRQF